MRDNKFNGWYCVICQEDFTAQSELILHKCKGVKRDTK